MEGQDPEERRRKRLKSATEDFNAGYVTKEAYEQRVAQIYKEAEEELGKRRILLLSTTNLFFLYQLLPLDKEDLVRSYTALMRVVFLLYTVLIFSSSVTGRKSTGFPLPKGLVTFFNFRPRLWY